MGSSTNVSAEVSGLVPWTPADLAGSVVWFDSANGINLSGSTVLGWTDRYSGLLASNVTSTARPIVSTNLINGIAPLYFDGTSDFLAYLSPTNMLATDAKSIVSVLRSRANPGTYYGYSISTRVNYGGVDNSLRGWLIIANETFHLYGHTAGGNAYATAEKLTLNEIAIVGYYKQAGTTTNLVSVYENGTNYALAVNQSLNGFAELANGYTTIGQQGGAYAQMDLGEQIAASYVLTQSDRQKVEGYLAHKWGLASNLPADHPYKAAAPTKINTTMAWVNNGSGWHHYASNTTTYVDGVTNSFTFSPWSWQTNTLVIGGTNYMADQHARHRRHQLHLGRSEVLQSDADGWRDRPLRP